MTMLRTDVVTRVSRATRVAIATDLRRLVTTGDVLDAATDLEVYGYDASFLTQLKPVVPDVAVIARSEADVIAVMRYAYEHRIPVTPRGPPVGAVAGVLRCEAGLSLP